MKASGPRNVNGIKTDNRPSNLEVEPSVAHHRSQHRATERGLRAPGAPNPTILCACGCGTQFLKFDSGNRPRRFVSGHNTGVRNG